MTDNPNIADLSDSNRPTKLGESFSELYDNEWTNALEELQKMGKMTDSDVVKRLLDILKVKQRLTFLMPSHNDNTTEVECKCEA